MRGYELYMSASGITPDGQKRQLFLHSAGPEVQDIFFTLTYTATTYVRDKLNEYFTTCKNTSYMFRQDSNLKNMGKLWLSM